MTDMSQGGSKLTDKQKELLARLRRGEQGAEVEQIPKRQGSGPAPLSFAQQRLWFLDQFAPGSPVYNIPGAIRIQGPLSLSALKKSLVLLCQRHDTLRTTFTTIGDEAVQVVSAQPIVSLPVIDADNMSDDELMQVMTERARMPFDLRHGPLLSTTLYRRGTDDHVLLLVVHHIVFDGWSFGIMFDDIARLYGAVMEGRQPDLAPLPVQYADFAVWQREMMSGQCLQDLLDYWAQQLDGAPPTLEFPFDGQRAGELKFVGGEQRFSIRRDLYFGLKRSAERCNGTMFMALLSAYAALLFRYSHQHDLVIGTNIANRTRVELERMIGFFAGTLPMRVDLSGDPAFSELLERVRSVSLGAFDHQDLPFEKLVEHLHPERDLSRNPLFQAMFVLQNAPRASLRAGDLEYSMLPVFTGTAKFDLWLSAVEERDRIDVTVEYDKQLLLPDTVDRLIVNFQTLLSGIADDPDQPLSRLPLLSPQQREQIICSFNDTLREYPERSVLHGLITDTMLAEPDRCVLSFQGESYTGKEFLCARNRLAHRLREAGVGAGDIVGVLAHRSADMVIALHAVITAGGAYLPLDPDYPVGRLEFCLQDAGAQVVICDEDLIDVLADQEVTVISPQRDRENIAGYPDHVPDNVNSSDDIAYVIYTSGSTGQPKGVMVPHRGICNRLRWMQDQYQLTVGDKVLQKTPYTFDVSVWEFFWSFMSAGELVVAVPDGHRDPEYLVNTIVEQGVTVIHFVPSMLRLFLMHPEISSCRSLRLVVASGEALTTDLVRGLYDSLPDVKLENLYGPTEASVDVTYWSCPRGELPDVIPIGYPVANTQLYVVDRHMQPVPIGVIGELFIGGVQLATGYLNRPQLTEERFVRDPFSDCMQARLYRTGDLARYLGDGAIEFCGRVDFQVKLHGLRIELGEIETAIRKVPTVSDTVVVMREDGGPGTAALVAYVVPDRRAIASAVDLEDEVVDDWQQVFDDAYANPGEDPMFNIAGWNSSYDGEPIPADQMREWTERTVESVLACKPQRVLEIGVGTGLLLLRIAPYCERYVGLDLSETALSTLEKAVSQLGIDGVELHCAPAHGLSRFEPQSFDMVILNSVVQYFPGVDYLIQVLSGLCRLIRPGGSVFIGDVRDYRLADTFNTAVELARADDNVEVERLVQRAEHRARSDDELLIDPAFFYRLPEEMGIDSFVRVMKKPGWYDNELSRYRYDVLLMIGGQSPEVVISWQDYQAEMTEDWIRDYLRNEQPEWFGIKGIPDRRLALDVKQANLARGASSRESVGRVRWIMSRTGVSESLHPESLRQLGQETGYEVLVTPAAPDADPTVVDVVFGRGSLPAVSGREGNLPQSELISDPLHERLVKLLVPALRTSLTTQLPDYMIPASFVVLDELPLNASGKVDRGALPAPAGPILDQDRGYRAPTTEIESVLCAIIASVLSLDRVGVDDNFFDLGLDSIRTIQVVSRARSAGIVLEPRALFQHQDVASLAEVAVQAATLLAEQGSVTGEFRLTPGQQRFLLRGGEREHYRVIRLLPREKIDMELMEAAVARLIDHHDGLRLDSDGDCYQLLLPSQHSDHPPIMLEQRSDGLVLKIRSFLVDEQSLRILLEDLERVYKQLVDGLPAILGDKSVSVRRWSEHVAEIAVCGEITCREVGGIERESVVLSGDLDRTLIEGNVLAIAGAAATAACMEHSGCSEVVVELLGDGRLLTETDADTSRTVGDLTLAVQVVAGKETADPSSIMEKISSILGGDKLEPESERLASVQVAAVLQDWNAALWQSIDLQPSPLLSGDPGLKVLVRLEGGQVVVDVQADLDVHEEGTAGRFAQSLTSIMADLIASEKSVVSGAEVTEFGWDEAQLDAITRALAEHLKED